MLKHGLGKKMEEKLNAQGILNLGNLMDALNTPAPLLALKGFTLNKVTLWTGVLADSLLDGACPPPLSTTKSTIIRISPAIPIILMLSSMNMERKNGRQR